MFDLKPFDAEFCPKEEQLTQEDIETEKIIDHERYLELHTDIVEQATYEGKLIYFTHLNLVTVITLANNNH